MNEPEDWRASAHWQALAATALSGSQDYDRAILTLSSGALALSATFLHDIARNVASASLDLLTASWVALIAAIISIVASFQTSQLATRQEMLNKDSKYAFRATVVLNVLGGLGFIGGMVLFARFAFVNL